MSASGRVVDPDLAGRSHGLHPGGGVDRVTGHHALADRSQRHRDLPGGDADPHRQSLDARFLTQRGRRTRQVQAGPHRPLRVVLPCGGNPPDREHGVTDELLHRSAVPLDHGPRPFEVRREQLADLLRVAGLRDGGEADQVGEQQRHDAPLGDRYRRGHAGAHGVLGCGRVCRQWSAALGAEPATGRHRAARRTADGDRCAARRAESRAVGQGRAAGAASFALHRVTVSLSRGPFQPIGGRDRVQVPRLRDTLQLRSPASANARPAPRVGSLTVDDTRICEPGAPRSARRSARRCRPPCRSPSRSRRCGSRSVPRGRCHAPPP